MYHLEQAGNSGVSLLPEIVCPIRQGDRIGIRARPCRYGVDAGEGDRARAGGRVVPPAERGRVRLELALAGLRVRGGGSSAPGWASGIVPPPVVVVVVVVVLVVVGVVEVVLVEGAVDAVTVVVLVGIVYVTVWHADVEVPEIVSTPTPSTRRCARAAYR